MSQQTLQDILNTIQWESYEQDINESPSTSSRNSEREFMEDFMQYNESRQSTRSKGSIALVQHRIGTASALARRTLETAQSAMTGTISMPSTPAYSTYSYYQDLDDEYERALNEFDEVEQEAMTVHDDSFDEEFGEGEEFDEESDADTSYDTIEDEDVMENKENLNTQNRLEDGKPMPDTSRPASSASAAPPHSSHRTHRASRKSQRRSTANTTSRRSNRKRKHPDALTTLDTATSNSDSDSVELSQEQLYHLHLDQGELDNFRSSVLSIKQEMEHIDFEEKKKNIAHIQQELEHMERKQSRRKRRRQDGTEEVAPAASGTEVFATPQDITPTKRPSSPTETDSIMSDTASIDDSLTTYSTPQKTEETLLKLKEEHYLTIRSGMETEDDPLHDLLKSVEEINMISEQEISDDVSLISMESGKPQSAASMRTSTPVTSSIKLRNSTQREKEILEQLHREQQEREDKKRHMKEEHRQRMERIRREREEHEQHVALEQQQRLERERQREEAFRREEEERRRENAVRLMRREEQLMRDYMFELQQMKLEEERRLKEMEEKKRREWEAEQERIRQEELRKAEERRNRLEMERKERERLAHERFLREQEEKKRRELEEQQRLEAERQRKLEEERRQRDLARRAFLLQLKKQHEQHRLDSNNALNKMLRSVLRDSSKPKPGNDAHSLLSTLNQWNRDQRTHKQSTRTRVDLSAPEQRLPPQATQDEEIPLDDDLIEVLSGAFDTPDMTVDTAEQLINLIVSVERITSIGKVTREEFTRVLSLVLDENALQSLQGVEQFPHLRYLSAKLNDLKQLGGVQTLKRLMELNVETNQLENLQGIEGCTSLRSLNASHNKLTKLDHITKCKKLNVLKLYRNMLTNLDFVSHLDNLLELDGGRNQISSITPSTFLHAPLLHKLVLYQNQLENMPPTHANILLRQLYLNGNAIEQIDTKPLFHPLLEYLNVSDNKLAHLSALQHFVSLKNVNMSFNAISSLDELEAFRNTSIETLKANDNPVCTTGGYRELLIALIPTLKVLDDEAVSERERDEVEVYCTMRNPRRYRALQAHIERLSWEDPLELIRQMRDEHTMWYHICRDANREYEMSQQNVEETAYKSMCARQSAEYIALNSYYKKKLYIPLNKKTDQEKYKETLRLKEEYYTKWNALARKHLAEHEHFNVQQQQNVVVYNNKFREEEAAIKIQRAFRAHRGGRKTRAAIKIQAFVRGALCRAKNLPWIIEQLRTRHRAAIKIQAMWRGFQVRHILWKARQIDPMIDQYLDGLEQVDLDEFNFDPTNLDHYELKAELPRERKVDIQPIAADRFRSRREGSISLVPGNGDLDHEKGSGSDPHRRGSASSTASSEEDTGATMSSVYRKKFHSTYMKQRVSGVTRGAVKSSAVSSQKPHTMDILDRPRRGVEPLGVQHERKSHPTTQEHFTPSYSSAETVGVPGPSRARSPVRNDHEETHHQRYQEQDEEQFDEDDEDNQFLSAHDHNTSSISASGKKKKIDQDKETWQFKDQQTASAWEKWAKKRRNFKKQAEKKKVPEDPMDRFKRLQKKVGTSGTKTRRSVVGSSTGATAAQGSGSQVFVRRTPPGGVSASMQSSHSAQDIDIESVSSIRSQEFSSMPRPSVPRGQVPLHHQTYTFPESGATNTQSKSGAVRRKR